MNERHNPLINETLLQMKFARIVSSLAMRLGIAEEDALGIFYNSETYRNLSDTRNGLQNLGDACLVDDIVSEIAQRAGQTGLTKKTPSA